MRKDRNREAVSVGGGPPPPPPVPLAVIVHEGEPDRVELGPRPDHHSPTEVVAARVGLLDAIRSRPPISGDTVAARIAEDDVGMARVVEERDRREAAVVADRARRRSR